MSKRLPNVLGCTFGFGAAGSGLGVTIGSIVGGEIWKAMSDADQAVRSRITVIYQWMDRGIICGVVLGVIVGFCYALIVRRLRSKGSSAASETSVIDRSFS